MKTTLSILGLLLTLTLPAFAQDAAVAAANPSYYGLMWGILGAAVAAFGGAFGSSVGVGVCGEVGCGVLTEDGKKFGSVLVLQALPMTQAIYGLLIAFLIMQRLSTDLTAAAGLSMLFAGLPIAVAGVISGIWQGRVSAAAMQLIARKPKQMGQAIILPAMVETFAVFALLISILLLGRV